MITLLRVLFPIVLFVLAAPAYAQDAVVSGSVTDAQGGGIPRAEVRIHREDGAVWRVVATDDSGTYRIGDLPAGVFILEIAADGFRHETEVVTLAPGSTVMRSVELSVAGIDDAVVVTAAGAPQIALEASKAITVIDSAEITARNETSLGDVVRFTPGVQVRNTGGPGQLSSMRIRGLRPDATAVLVDGMRFRDAATLQGDATSFLSTLNFVAADRVEVLRGSGSSLYGTNAVGGVVNIVTRPGGGAFRGEGQVEAGSLGHIRARGAVNGGAWGDRLRYSAGALQFNVLEGLDGNDANRSTGVQGLVDVRLTPTANVMARLLGSNDRVQTNTGPTASGIPAANIAPSIIVNAVPVDPAQIALSNRGLPFQIGSATVFPGRDDPDSTRTSAFHTSAFRYGHSGWQAASWQASYQHVYTRRVFLNGPLGRGFQPTSESFSHIVGQIDTADVRAFFAPIGSTHVTVGYEFERERFHDRQDSVLFGAGRIQTETRIRQDAHAAFASAQFALADRRLQLSVSARAQRFHLSNPRLNAVGARSPYDGVPVVSPPSALTGDVSAAYVLAPSETKFRAHAGNAFRAPAMYERFGGGFDADPVTGRVGFTPYGDPRLEPDRYQTIDAGVDQYLFESRLLVSATAFYNNVTSLTAFDASGAIRPETDRYGRVLGYRNSSGGFSRGIETAVEARPTSSLRLSGGYTYTRSETAEAVTIPGFFLVPGVYAHVATFVATSRWGRVDAAFDLFRGGSMYVPYFAAGSTRAFKYPGFTRIAIVAGYRLIDHDRAPVRIYAKVDNLLNETYYDTGWRAPGRTAIAGLSVGF